VAAQRANRAKENEVAVKRAENNVIELKQLRLERVEIALYGVSPIISHKWSHKAKEQMLAKQMKKATAGKQAKDPQQDFEESIYLCADGLPGFPSVAFKAAAVDAAMAMDFKKTNLRQSFHIEGEMVALLGDDPTPREDMVRVGMGTADIRYRAQFQQWAVVLPVTINTGMLSVEQLVNLFDAAGFGIGVGEWRPQKDGQYGRFKVADKAEETLIQEWRTERASKAQRIAA
jgi:hypothetical protein